MDIEVKNTGRLLRLKLKNVARINYLVGENRSGKSSFLAGILKNTTLDHHLARAPFKSYYRPDSDLAVTNLPNSFVTFKVALIDPITVFSPFHSPNNSSLVNLAKKTASKENLGVEEEQLQRSGGRPSGQNLYGFSENPDAGMTWDDAWNSVASGNKSLEHLGTKLAGIGKSPQQVALILIDEPEIHLHPKLHGKIHELLLKKIAEDPSFYILVTTHSSSLITSAAKEQSDTKVYCLAEGSVITNTAYWTDSADRMRHIAEESDGFKPSECKLLVHDILGPTLENYFPKIIYCEGSLKDFMESFFVKNPGLYETPLIIPAGGDLSVIGKTSVVSKIMSELQAHRKWQMNLLGPVAYGIIDKLNSSQTAESALLRTVVRDYQASVIMLGEEEIEASYPEGLVQDYLQQQGLDVWNKQSKFKKHLEDQGMEGEDLGVLKSELAKYVGENITPDQFVQNFSPIDVLLKNH